MNILAVFTVLAVMSSSALALKLSDYRPYSYEVFFTNPICEEQRYETPVEANDGSILYAKPKDAYCSRSDFDQNAQRIDSPHFQLVKLINEKNIDSLFFTFLSFSNDDIANEICDAIKRNVKVSFIIDSTSEDRPSSRSALDMIASCRPENLRSGEEANLPKTYFRGNSRGIGYAHNKMIIANYKNSEKVRLVYGSGNMSSGTTLHHENWHFVTTNKNTFLAQSHECVRKAMLESGNARKDYKNTFGDCRNEIPTSEEEDIQMMVVPSDGKKALGNILTNLENSIAADIAVHRFTHTAIVEGLQKAARSSKKIRFIADDDIYWTGARRTRTGSNLYYEFINTMKVIGAGAQIRYIESNQGHYLLHHNKYIIFNYADGSGAVHTGAGNFTKAAFSKNMENYYFITVPSVVKAFKNQYERMFNIIGTPYEKMPSRYVMP